MSSILMFFANLEKPQNLCTTKILSKNKELYGIYTEYTEYTLNAVLAVLSTLTTRTYQRC